MRKRIKSLFSGEGVRARALRGSALTLANFGGTNLLRLASNLVLTRLLFPEAFGLMALVQVFMTGLQMFSDIGIKTSIMQHARGDEENFLNTAWTLQILRGIVLWLAACALALPASWLYAEPMLTQLLPIVGLNAVLDGLNTTNVATANRHLRLGRQTVIELGCQAFAIVATVILAWLMQSVWALVIGNLIGSTLKRSLLHWYMPGIRNRLHWDPTAAREVMGFGKFIFFSTVAGFVISQGDRAILGGFISLADLGVYGIGAFLGTVPLLLSRVAATKVIFPLYRLKPPAESAANRANMQRARRYVIVSLLAICVLMAFLSVPLVEFLYDPRYHKAGPVVTLFSLSIIPQLTFAGYGGALLSNGDSKRHFYLLTTTAAVQSVLMFLFISQWGMFGAIISPGVAALVTYPMRTRFVGVYKANDNLADAVFIGGGLVLNGLACWLYWDAIKTLIS